MKTIKSVRNIMMLGILFTTLLTPKVRAQEKINLAAGLGFPELVNFGVRFQTNQNTRQIALSLGYGAWQKFSLSGDMFFHFGGYSMFSVRQPWYVRGGLMVLYVGEWAPVFNLRLGRDINFSKKIGLNLDAGIAVSPFGGLVYEKYKLMPGFGFSFFYRI